MKNTFEQQIYEIFGTTDPKELRRLSKDAEQYQQLAKKEALRHAAGRKPAFSLPQIIQMAALQQQGKYCRDRAHLSGQQADGIQSNRPCPLFQHGSRCQNADVFSLPRSALHND